MRTTDKINAMTVPELRAAVAVDLLGWERLTAWEGAFILRTNDGSHATPTESVWSSYVGVDGKAHPGGWLGVVDDAMIARPAQWQPMHRVVQMFRGPRWFAGYVRARDFPLICYEHADRETATLRAVLLALAAEDSAKGGNE